MDRPSESWSSWWLGGTGGCCNNHCGCGHRNSPPSWDTWQVKHTLPNQYYLSVLVQYTQHYRIRLFSNTCPAYTPLQNWTIQQYLSTIHTTTESDYSAIPVWHTHHHTISAIHQYLSNTHTPLQIQRHPSILVIRCNPKSCQLARIHPTIESAPSFNTYLAYTPIQNQHHPSVPVWHTHQYRMRASARIVVNDCLLRRNPNSHLLISIHTTKESVPSVSTYLLVQLPSHRTSRVTEKLPKLQTAQLVLFKYFSAFFYGDVRFQWEGDSSDSMMLLFCSNIFPLYIYFLVTSSCNNLAFHEEGSRDICIHLHGNDYC